MSKDLSIYVHIPFCVRKCNYCDFLSFYAKKDVVEMYFEALKKEIMLSAKGGDLLVKSIFFGGGTPSFVEAEKICDTLKTIQSSFAVAENAEISIEVNPASAMSDKLIAYREAGFNRLSIGAQSLDDEELKVLGRAHTGAMFFETFENARKAGFDNINVDVMSALPGQSLKSYVQTLEKVLSLKPEHISAYSLILEEGTPFYDMELDLPDEDTDRAMYHETKEILDRFGYHRYEISNYALGEQDDPKYECYHNKVYWKRGNYLGLGIGAASMVDNVRWSNVRDIHLYVDAQMSKVDREILSPEAQMEEFMFLGLRLVEGVSIEEFKRQFGRDIWEVYGEVIDKYAGLGLLEYSRSEAGRESVENTYLRLTDKGLDVSNTVMAEFIL
ncbi:radical SAM family heme chaperone HemW [Butyrivibrio sp. AE2032]|uniref:radical SAM family heme chaperone HemW n=1 Tax=Butyrivibrio sp. AE2032 TaxID=1458463 RepID=UPI000555404F|nr:radical SAM family heme chaperone HemW [Butyrivibrio sp. AE2032]